jgi:hypothetical protein
MRYTDYLQLIKPRNQDFSEYVNRKMHDSDIGYDMSLSFGMKDATRVKFGRLFKDMVKLENELEMQRKYKISQLNVSELFRLIDTEMKGFCTLHDYNQFFYNL